MFTGVITHRLYPIIYLPTICYYLLSPPTPQSSPSPSPPAFKVNSVPEPELSSIVQTRSECKNRKKGKKTEDYRDMKANDCQPKEPNNSTDSISVPWITSVYNLLASLYWTDVTVFLLCATITYVGFAYDCYFRYGWTSIEQSVLYHFIR